MKHWVHDKNWLDSLVLLESKPTINIEGLVAGYTGPGGKTVLPHRAVAKIDMRLVPDMTATDTLAKLKAHLAKHGFGDLEVNMSGGYNPTQTDPNSRLIQDRARDLPRSSAWSRSCGRARPAPGRVRVHRCAAEACRRGTSAWGTAPGRTHRMSIYVIESANPKVQGTGRCGGLVRRVSCTRWPERRRTSAFAPSL